MIYRLEIENFYSIRDRQVIDLTVGKKAPDEPGRLVRIHDGSEVRAPKIVAVYGANASGKSNLLRVIPFLAWFFRWSFQYPAKKELPYFRFRTEETYEAPTRLSITLEGCEKPLANQDSPTCPYVYTLEISPCNDGSDRVLSESLYFRPRSASRQVRIFERDASGEVKVPDWVGLGRNLSVLNSILRSNASVIATLGQLNNELALSFIQFVKLVFTNILITTIRHDERELLEQYYRNPKLLEALNRDVRRIDLGIDQVRISSKDGHPAVRIDHAGLDRSFPMSMESQGTERFFHIFPILHHALEKGGVAVVDECDVSIHPAILPEILRWFTDPDRNPYGAQLWMGCHAASLLDDLLKEEVLICEKNADGATEIYGLDDVKGVRRGENYRQNYLGGVYGGVPSIG